MDNPAIYTIDLNFRGRHGTIGAYLVPTSAGAIMVESGPGSTIPALLDGIHTHGFSVENITDLFLTHIHLDHAGAAGWLAQQGCRIHVHELGAPHLINPEKLLASAGRLYGDKMDMLWGKFLPVEPEMVHVMHNDEVVIVGDLSIHAVDVPGHASHHLAYLIGDACFSGDIGGLRLSPTHYLSLPMPPPDLNLEKWRESIHTLQGYTPRQIVPTHFGVYPDAHWHLQAVLDALDEIEAWMEDKMPQQPPIEELRQEYIRFEYQRAEKYHIDKATVDGQQVANPSFLSADGIFRYWNKFRMHAGS
jgi:glyoxylase-like metal-dependent hydrolase (beta-lactamase superfamily II)